MVTDEVEARERRKGYDVLLGVRRLLEGLSRMVQFSKASQ